MPLAITGPPVPPTMLRRRTNAINVKKGVEGTVSFDYTRTKNEIQSTSRSKANTLQDAKSSTETTGGRQPPPRSP